MSTTTDMPLRFTGVRILLVEDDGDLLDLLATYLEEHGASVVRARTVTAARAALTRSGSFDLLVSDLALPDGHGHELGLTARRAGVRAAIALTGIRGDDAVDASRTVGFTMHVTKPCDLDTFGRVVETATGRNR